MRQFYNTFPNSHTLSDQLTWSYMGELKKTFALGGVNTCEGYLGLQREFINDV